MNILNGTEAFAALAAGQKIECRHMQAGEFDDIRNFPATVYFDAEYEFRLAIKFFQIGEMQVPEPIQEAPAKGTQCYAPSLLTEELSKSFKWKNSYSDLVILGRGQVHLIQEHAETHALALITVSCGIFEDSQKDTSIDVEQKTTAENLEPQPNQTSLPEEIETDHFDESNPAIHKFVDAIEKCQSDYELQGVERNLEGNKSKIHASEYAELTHRIQLKRESFFASNEHTLDLESLKQLQQDAEDLIQYQQSLDEYIQRVKNAKTPAEANALVKYTGSWTEEQRKPLIDAINARLVELNPPVNDASLSVRISKAADLTELDALEIDVSSCDEFIQPKLMELVHKRRAELDPFFSPLGNAS